MKKIILIIAILVVFGIGGYFYLNSRGLTSKTLLTIGNKSTKKVFNNLQEALSKSMNLKCVYKDEKGLETTTYIKNGNVRVMMTNSKDPEELNNIIIKDKKMYMWSDQTKKGFVFENTEPYTSPYPTFEVKKELEPEKKPGLQQQESILAQIEKYKDACKVEKIADSMFNIPTNVQFEDMNKVQEQMMKQIPQAPSGENQEEMQKYIQDMMKQQGIEK